LVGLGIAIYLPWADRRHQRRERAERRLAVTTFRRAADKMLQLGLAYDPEARSTGYEARVWVIEPAAAIVIGARRTLGYEGTTGQLGIATFIDEIKPLKGVVVPFDWHSADPDNSLRAVAVGAPMRLSLGLRPGRGSKRFPPYPVCLVARRVTGR
jgi:hypothetical protein